MFHNAASNIVCQVLFGTRYDHDDDFIKVVVQCIQENSKIANGPWAMVSHVLLGCGGKKLRNMEPLYDVLHWSDERASSHPTEGRLSCSLFCWCNFLSFQLYDSLPVIRKLPLPFMKAFKNIEVGVPATSHTDIKGVPCTSVSDVRELRR